MKWLFNMFISWIKYTVARIWKAKLAEEMLELRKNHKIDEKWNQKWIHLQGQVLTKGKMKWNWKKVL